MNNKKNIPTHDPQTGELNPYYEELTGEKNPFSSDNSKRSIKEMTYKELYHIANIATGGWTSSEFSREHKEVEVGGYGWRRRLEWVQNTEGYDEYHYFEITGENKGDGWQWYCKTTDSVIVENLIDLGKPNWGLGHLVNTLNPHKIVDYCRGRGLDIENTLR